MTKYIVEDSLSVLMAELIEVEASLRASERIVKSNQTEAERYKVIFQDKLIPRRMRLSYRFKYLFTKGEISDWKKSVRRYKKRIEILNKRIDVILQKDEGLNYENDFRD